MKYAKSMYCAGDIVSAGDCNYESAKKLGLVCPFCHQAIFLRAGTFFDRKGKNIVMPAAFCHYKTDDVTAHDCELRSSRKDGQEYLDRLKMESRGQRLDQYNQRLWEIIKKDLNITSLKAIKEAFGGAWIQTHFLLCRKELATSLEFYSQQLEMFMSKQYQQEIKLKAEKKLSTNAIKHASAFDKKRDKYEIRLHSVIAQEVLMFLSTRTGGYALRNIFTLNLLEFCTNFQMILLGTNPNSQAYLFAKKVKSEVTTQHHLEMICHLLINVDWVENLFELDQPGAPSSICTQMNVGSTSHNEAQGATNFNHRVH